MVNQRLFRNLQGGIHSLHLRTAQALFRTKALTAYQLANQGRLIELEGIEGIGKASVGFGLLNQQTKEPLAFFKPN